MLSDGSDPRRAHNRYPERWQRAAREVLEARHPDGDWIMLSRSGWLRAAHASQVVWAGDQEATWDDDGLRTVIPALVSLGMAGVGYCTHDVAGFSGGPSSRDLYQRRVELAAFTPVFRTHEGLLGDALLVAPVVTMGATSRSVYFPPGPWFDVWDPSRRYEGPMEATVDAPIGRPPVFSRAPRSDLAAVR